MNITHFKVKREAPTKKPKQPPPPCDCDATPKTSMNVYKMDCAEWWCAYTAKEAEAVYRKEWGSEADELMEYPIEALTAEGLDHHTYVCDDDHRHSFRVELALRTHRAGILRVVGDVMFACGVCRATYSTQFETQRHMLSHSVCDREGHVEKLEKMRAALLLAKEELAFLVHVAGRKGGKYEAALEAVKEALE